MRFRNMANRQDAGDYATCPNIRVSPRQSRIVHGVRQVAAVMQSATRLEQSPLSMSRHTVMLPLRPYFSISLWT
jgi:hypothetical protein